MESGSIPIIIALATKYRCDKGSRECSVEAWCQTSARDWRCGRERGSSRDRSLEQSSFGPGITV